MDDKEKKRIYDKEYYQKNKEKRKQYDKEYREKNKEKKRITDKEYYEKNKEKLKQNSKEWIKNNKEKREQYLESEACKKSYRISKWKRYGIITDDYDKLYEKYLNTKNCELCNCELTVDKRTTKTTRCMDHDHSITDSDNVRNILCHSCNSKLPRQ